MSTATAFTSAYAIRGCGPAMLHTTNVIAAIRITVGTKYPAITSATCWIGARLRCASAVMRTICASSVSLPTRSARMIKLPVMLMVPPVTFMPADFSTGHRLARHHGFVNRARSFKHHSVHGNFFARPNAQMVADMHLVERDVLLAPVLPNHARGFRRQAEQRTERARRLAARPQFEHLSQQHQRGDYRRGLKVHCHRSAVPSKRVREDPRRDGCNQAVKVRRASAHGDQREHIWTAMDYRCPGAFEERPPAPQHHGSCQRKLNPNCEPPGQQSHCALAGDHLAHGHQQNRRSQREAHPEAARHVDQLGILALLETNGAAAPAPCRRSGKRQDRRAQPPGASDRYMRRRRLPVLPASAPRQLAQPCTFRDSIGTGHGSGRCRSTVSFHRMCMTPRRALDQPSCRRQGLWPVDSQWKMASCPGQLSGSHLMVTQR